MLHDACHAKAAVAEHPRQIAAYKCIHDEYARHNEYGDTHHAAAQLKEDQNADDPRDDINRVVIARARRQPLKIDDPIEKRAEAQDAEHEVIPWNIIGLRLSLPRRVEHKAHKNHDADKKRTADLLRQCGKDIHPQHEKRKRDQHRFDRNAAPGGEVARVRLSVVLRHDLFNIDLFFGKKHFVMPGPFDIFDLFFASSVFFQS